MSRKKLDIELAKLKSQLIELEEIKEQIWKFHPGNPEFINPITIYGEINITIENLRLKINEITLKFNSLN